MADQDIKDFTVSWILFGLLFFSLMIFTVNFMYNNNPDALGSDVDSKFEIYQGNLSRDLLQLEDDSNELLNISAITDSENQNTGTRVSASTSYGFWNSASQIWNNSIDFIGWMFSGTVGQILIGVFGGLIGLSVLFFIIRLGRTFF